MDAPEISPRPKTPRNHPLRASLHARGLTDAALAKLARTSRAQVTLTLQNRPGRGHHTRPRLIPHLTPRELVLLRWAPDEKTAAQLQQRLAENSTAPKTHPRPAAPCSTRNVPYHKTCHI